MLELLLHRIYVCALIFLTALNFLIAINCLTRYNALINALIRQLYLLAKTTFQITIICDPIGIGSPINNQTGVNAFRSPKYSILFIKWSKVV